MKLRRSGGATGWQNLLVSTLLCTNVWAKKDAPAVKSTKLSHAPRNLQYFEDSDIVLYQDETDRNVYRSANAGETWDKVSDVPEGKLLELSMHPFNSDRAYILTVENRHWSTKDRGKTWQDFTVDADVSMFRLPFTYHAGDADRILFNAMECTGVFCEELTLYTTDGFASKPTLLRRDTVGCHWAKSSVGFTTGQTDLDNSRILCVVKGRFSPWRKDFRLLMSDNFFAAKGDAVDEYEPELESGRTVQGIVNMAVVTKYLVVAASAENTDEMALYISDDSKIWHRAIFPHDHKVTEEAYTLLEGTNYSVQVDVMNTRESNPMGVFFSSNSNGTYFTRNVEHTNRNTMGLVDFEKMSGVQGIIFVNTVQNWEEVEKSNARKQIVSTISFDDGRTWHDVKVGKDRVHLHSVTELRNSGRVFSSPAPGIVMGVGNTGDFLKNYDDGDLFVSDDAGLTWRHALDGPHKYEFGDQGSVLVAVKDGFTDEIRYSLNHGHDWAKVGLPDKINPLQLTTTQDSTSLKFLLIGEDDKNEKADYYIVAIDFEEMHADQCKAEDMEEWFARVDDDNNPTCLMGHKQSYKRRKADADCFLKSEFKDPEVVSTACSCTDADFECDYNFVRSDDGKECILSGSLVLPEGACKESGPDDTFLGSSGWRLIPGNDCKRVEGIQKDDLVKTKCAGAITPPASGHIVNSQKTFQSAGPTTKMYLERTGTSTGDDETVLMATTKGPIFLSHDHGKTWDEILAGEKIQMIYPHPYFNDAVYFVTDSDKVWYSVDRGKNLRSFTAPSKPSESGPAMNFHPKNKDWIIWIGAKDCGSGQDCHNVASITKDRGDGGWQTLKRYVRTCEFVKETESQKFEDTLIFCEAREKENNDHDNPWQLVSSSDFFTEPGLVHFTDVEEFAIMSEFIIVATHDKEHGTLKLDTSADGATFADAQFPHGFEVPHQTGYTVLDSSTHSVFLHVTVSNTRDREYGTIIKSNSNGTSYILSLNAVNRDTAGYVDFEKSYGIEGVAVVNIIANYDSPKFQSEGKQLKTMMTHNDGAEWDYITPPASDGEGKKFGCSGPLNKCSLHIHGYTERPDRSHTYSSVSAIGLMFGVGNVGEFLTSFKDADTFMSTDAGVSWKFVMKGTYMWEYGDQGSILVIVKERSKTNIVFYSLDEGDNWLEYKFSDTEVMVRDLTTVPSDNSQKFLLWAESGDDLVTISIDFSGLTDTQCKLDEARVEAGDYYLWVPRHPKQDNDCLFGHVSQYHRKKPASKCYNGRMIPHLHDIEKNCSCTRQDFECDFNYERQTDGSCALVAGLSPQDHSLTCKEDQDAVEWYDPTGYRRIPLSTCSGGKEMDLSVAHPCQGKEDEFRKKRGPSALGIFFAIVIPIVVAGGVGYWVWRNWSGKFGQIRLGEQSLFNDDAPHIKYPVMVLAALVAVAQALPLLVASLWRSASSMLGGGSNRRFTTRDSFARGRGDYAVVDEDEGELLGDESDEEV